MSIFTESEVEPAVLAWNEPRISTTTYDPRKHYRQSIRLKGYDYTQPGAYFVTICTHRRNMLFGRMVNGVMQLNE